MLAYFSRDSLPTWWVLWDSIRSREYYFDAANNKRYWFMPKDLDIMPIPMSSDDDARIGRYLVSKRSHKKNKQKRRSTTIAHQINTKPRSEETKRRKTKRTKRITKQSTKVSSTPKPEKRKPRKKKGSRATKSIDPETRRKVAITFSPLVLEDFASKGFLKKGKVLGGKKLQKAVSWQKKAISKPLIYTTGQDAKEAVSIFKLIQSFMGDGNEDDYGKMAYATTLIHKGLELRDLRTEIYCQTIKQISDNTIPTSAYSGWDLLALICKHFPPSNVLITHVRAMFDLYQQKGNETQKLFARYCSKQLARIESDGARLVFPHEDQLAGLQNAAFKTPIFGSSLEDIMDLQIAQGDDSELPTALVLLAEAVERCGGFFTEGIFRVPGEKNKVNDVVVSYDNLNYDIEILDPNVAASALKYWFRELDNPLIPYDMYDECIDHAKNGNKSGSVEAFKRAPELNKRVVEYLIAFLRRLAVPESIEKTKMGPQNLAMVFAPSFLRCPTDDPAVIIATQKYQQNYVLHLIEELDLD